MEKIDSENSFEANEFEEVGLSGENKKMAPNSDMEERINAIANRVIQKLHHDKSPI